MNYRPELSTDGGKSFGQNAQVFAKKEDAEWMAKDIFGRWFAATDWRVTETMDPVNYVVGEVDGDKMAIPIRPATVESEGGDHD